MFGQEIPTFRTGVSLVKVDVQVVEHNGHIVPDLTRDDFEVFDEGKPQKITYFGRESEPLDLLLLLDVSGSMRRSLEQLAGAAAGALKQLFEQDRVAVMLFSRSTLVRQSFTADFQAVEAGLRDSVREQSLGSGTAINFAIVSAAQYLQRQPVRGRRAVLIITDNLSLNYRVPDEDVIRELYRADAVLNAILIGKQRRPDAPKPGSYANPDFTPSDVLKLAEETGGEALEAAKIGASFQTMIERIRARYSLQYAAPEAEPGAYRHIRVQLSDSTRRRYRNVVIRARSGYYSAMAQ